MFVLEHVHDLLVGDAVRQHGGRRSPEVGGHRADRLGRGRQRRAFGLGLAQAAGDFADPLGTLAFAQFDPVQELLDDGVGHHASRHPADLPAGRRSIRPAGAE